MSTNGYANFVRKVNAMGRRRKRASSPSLTERILKLLREKNIEVPGTDADYELIRTRAGHWQRSEGAWSWYLQKKHSACKKKEPSPSPFVGSIYPARMCITSACVIGTTKTCEWEIWPPEHLRAEA